MSEKTLLPPSLRVENGDYHEQAAEVMRSLIRFYDSMIKLGPIMRISQATLDKLKVRAELARDNLRKFIHLVPARKDKQELHILTYKKRLTEHCHLQHTIEIWKSALRNFSSLPQVPAEMLDFPPTYGPQPVTQMIDKILTDCSLPIELQQLRAEMVELEVLKPYSTITRESCRLFFDSLSDNSAMLRLNDINRRVTNRKSATLGVEKKDYRVNEPYDNSYMYIYPPGFTPSAATRAFLEEQVPMPKKTYVLPPDIFEKRKKVLPDISSDLQKEMERLAAQSSTRNGKPEKEASEFRKPIATVKKDTLRMNIDRYDEYLKIKKIMQGLIRPDNSCVVNTTLVDDTTDKQKIEEPSSQASEQSDIVKRNSATLASGTSFEKDSECHTLMDLSDLRDFPQPKAFKDKTHHAQERPKSKRSGEIAFKKRKRQRQIEASQEKTSGHFQAKSSEKVRSKHSDRAMKQRNEKKDRDVIGDGKDLYTEEPASKRLKVSPIQLSFLKSASVQGFKIPKRGLKCSKCLEIPKVGLKRKGHDAVETERCGKRSRNH